MTRTEQPLFTGVEFHADGRDLMLVDQPGSEYDGWLLYRHPDGQWVTLREATAEDYRAIVRECVRREAYAYEQSNFEDGALWHRLQRRYHERAQVVAG